MPTSCRAYCTHKENQPTKRCLHPTTKLGLPIILAGVINVSLRLQLMLYPQAAGLANFNRSQANWHMYLCVPVACFKSLPPIASVACVTRAGSK
jgi:hypothetical protein